MKNSLSKIAQRFYLRRRGFDPDNLDLGDLAFKITQQEDEIKKIRRRCKFENNSLIMFLSDGTQSSIDFTDVRGNKDMLDLFEVLFSFWRTKGTFKDGWVWVFVSKETIKKLLVNKGRKNVTDFWIKNTLSNLRKFKITPSRLKDHIKIGYYSRSDKVYPFGIKSI